MFLFFPWCSESRTNGRKTDSQCLFDVWCYYKLTAYGREVSNKSEGSFKSSARRTLGKPDCTRCSVAQGSQTICTPTSRYHLARTSPEGVQVARKCCLYCQVCPDLIGEPMKMPTTSDEISTSSKPRYLHLWFCHPTNKKITTTWNPDKYSRSPETLSYTLERL